MRSIGEFDREDQAALFTGYLKGIAIRAEVEEDEEGGSWIIWVHEEHQLEQARAELKQFRLNAEDSKYQNLALQASAKEREEEKQAKKQRWREERLARRWRSSSGLAGTCTLCLIGISVVVFLLGASLERHLMISRFVGPFLIPPEVLKGQVWRLLTPIFLHGDPLHLIFNMFWLFDLGGMIERRRGVVFLLLFVVFVGVFSNYCEYRLSGPSFGGMSGVVYGLFGYIWMKGKFDPGDGLALQPSTVMIMMVWFFLCFLGTIGGVANWAHGGGLLFGAGWGYLSARLQLRR